MDWLFLSQPLHLFEHKFTFTVLYIGSFIRKDFLWCRVFLKKWNYEHKSNYVDFQRHYMKNPIKSKLKIMQSWTAQFTELGRSCCSLLLNRSVRWTVVLNRQNIFSAGRIFFKRLSFQTHLQLFLTPIS